MFIIFFPPVFFHQPKVDFLVPISCHSSLIFQMFLERSFKYETLSTMVAIECFLVMFRVFAVYESDLCFKFSLNPTLETDTKMITAKNRATWMIIFLLPSLNIREWPIFKRYLTKNSRGDKKNCPVSDTGWFSFGQRDWPKPHGHP